MAIAQVGGQQASATADSTTSITIAYPGNVTNGNVLVIGVGRFSPSTNDPFVVGDISQSAGTATVGTFTLDVDIGQAVGTGFHQVALFSVPVTGTGSCTIQIGSGPASSFWFAGVDEYSDADITSSRVGGTCESSGNAGSGVPNAGGLQTSIASALVGICVTDTGASSTHTPGVDWATIAESEDGTLHQTGNMEGRVTTGPVQDRVDWTAPTTLEWTAVGASYKQTAAAASVNAVVAWLTA